MTNNLSREKCAFCKQEAVQYLENIPHCDKHFENAHARAYGKKLTGQQKLEEWVK